MATRDVSQTRACCIDNKIAYFRGMFNDGMKTIVKLGGAQRSISCLKLEIDELLRVDVLPVRAEEQRGGDERKQRRIPC